jgi:hypothetical protein
MCSRLLFICGIISMVLSGVVIFVNLDCVHTKSGNIYKLELDYVNIPPSIKTISQKQIHRSQESTTHYQTPF